MKTPLLKTVASKLWQRKSLRIVATLVLMVASLGSHAKAANKTWNVASGNWDVPGNWSPAGVPTFNDAVNINNNGTILVPVGISGISNDLIIGASGTGVLTISGGSVVSNYTYLGMNGTGRGTATVSGGSWGITTLYVGFSGVGSLSISGGSVSDGSATIGDSGNGTVSVTGGSWTNSSQLTVGFYGTGSLNIAGGTVSNSAGYLGVRQAGTATVSSGTWNNTSSLAIGGNGTGTLNLTNTGVVTVGSGAGTLTMAQNAGSTGKLNIGTGDTAGTLNTAIITGGSGTATVNFNHTGSTTFAPQLTGNLAVNKLGDGTTVLSASNTYTGPTLVESGRLKLDVNGSITSSSSVQLSPGGIFDTTALASGTFAMLGSQLFQFTLDPTGTGSAGLLAVTGLDISRAVVDFITLGTLDDAAYVIADYTSMTGAQFASVTNLPDGYFIDYDYNSGTEIAVVPEPSTWAMLALGVGIALLGLRRRRVLLIWHPAA